MSGATVAPSRPAPRRLGGPVATLTPGFQTWASRALDPAGIDLDDALAALTGTTPLTLPAALVAGWSSPDPSAVLPADPSTEA